MILFSAFHCKCKQNLHHNCNISKTNSWEQKEGIKKQEREKGSYDMDSCKLRWENIEDNDSSDEFLFSHTCTCTNMKKRC